ncbi:MAG: hypothetical protein H0U49_00575 [Parachlamydiaceae bacterium]|nr:hypothetical protein [Parachlamydiaceae bacterium]
MNWQTIDFQGIAGLESSLIHQLQLYLDEKESHLAQFIANSIPQMTESGPMPYLPEPLARTKLSDGVEAFSRRAHQDINQSQVSSVPGWQKVAGSINKAIWEYVEVLEGSAVELYQQVEQVGFEQWSPTLIQIIESIKDLLLHSMEDLKWAYKRLESQLKDYRSLSDNNSSLWDAVKNFFTNDGILDSAIPRNLGKSQKFLNFKYQDFTHRYNEFQELDTQVDKIMTKFSDYDLLDSIDPEEAHKFKQIYRVLKIWEQNLNVKVLTELELIRGIHRIINPEKASQVFKDYYLAIKNQVFDLSRRLKYRPESEIVKNKEHIQSVLAHYRLELHTLGATTAKYREFLLKSDPDPYVRTRGGFSEWVIGLEPTAAKPLLYQEYDIESLDQTILNFSESVRKNEMSTDHNEELDNEIWEILHDMGQPLASKQMMEVRSRQFVEHLQSLDELASSDPLVVENVTKFLSRALRADWKYNMLFDIPEFHLLYSIHQGILGPDSDRAHVTRMGEFRILTERLFKWIKEKKLIRHHHDVELDINDIKESLQDMLAYVQRTAKDPVLFNKENAASIIQDISKKLLEYRYLFNHFFHQLRGIESDEKLLRKQFLFVDHYFESIENRLIEMRNVQWD